MDEFQASIEIDRHLYAWDILGSQAHARMLGVCGVVKQQDVDDILRGLDEVRQEIEAGEFEFSVRLEDIHTHVEQRLIEKIGDAGKRLHTGRSRNDQVALDFRLYARHATDSVLELIRELQQALVGLADQYDDLVFPGYTHLQQAQPILFAHHLLAYYEMLQRDVERFSEGRERINVLPLGAAALAGTSYPLNREMVARELGFDRVAANSLDAVSDRDFVIEFNAHAAVLMMHLSRLCEEIIVWSSQEFSYIELSDAFCTGSSIMPQKKNPDAAELVRGKTGRVYGNLMSVLTMMKSLPLTYNKDMQEDKEPLFDSAQTISMSLRIMAQMLGHLRPKPERINSMLDGGFMTATEIADYLARRGVPFRTAHEVVGAIVRHCLKSDKTLRDLTLDDFQQFSGVFREDVLDVVLPLHAVNSKTSFGGTATPNVLDAIQRAKQALRMEA